MALASCAHPPAVNVLRVGTSADYAPFSRQADAAGLTGLDIDIARRLAADLGREVDFVRFTWPALPEDIARGAFDVAMSGVTMRPDRALLGRYTRPYATSGAVVLVRSSATHLATLDDLDQPGVRLAVNAGGHLEHETRRRFPRAVLQAIADNRAVIAALVDGRADGAITDSAEAFEWQRPDMRRLGPFTHDHKAYLLPVANVALAERLDAWMVAREADGWLGVERGRWLGPTAVSDAVAMGREAVAALIEIRLGLMPAVAAAKDAAQLPIEDRQQEAAVLERIQRAAGAAAAPAAAAVYTVLIDMAKAVQRQAAEPEVRAALPDLRDAIARIDEQLVREIGRRPSGTTADWELVLAHALDLPGIDMSLRDRLATALSANNTLAQGEVP